MAMPFSKLKEPIHFYIAVAVTKPAVPLEALIMERLAVYLFNSNPYRHRESHESYTLAVKTPQSL